MADIFICYRRDDSGAGQAGRLYDRLSNHFGHNRVFFDIDSLQFGDNFVEKIQGVLGRCSVALVVIGRDWLVRDEHNHIRLKNNKDYVRLEIAMALKRQGTKVIPVRVHGGRMPAKRDLPADLVPLLEHHGPELRDATWDRDVASLIRRLEKIVGRPGSKATRGGATKPPRKKATPRRESAGTSGRKDGKPPAAPEEAHYKPRGAKAAAKAPTKSGTARSKKPPAKQAADPRPRGTKAPAAKRGTRGGAPRQGKPAKQGEASPGAKKPGASAAAPPRRSSQDAGQGGKTRNTRAGSKSGGPPGGARASRSTAAKTSTGGSKSTAQPAKATGRSASPGASRTKSGPAKRIGTGSAPAGSGKAGSKAARSAKPGKPRPGGGKRGGSSR